MTIATLIKLLQKTVPLLLCIALTGCPSPEKVAIDIKQALSAGGTDVGTLPDGRHVIRYNVPDKRGWTKHSLYVVDGTPSVSTNSIRPKQPVQVDVVIGGVPYVPTAP